MVDRIRYPTVSYLPFYYVFFQFLLLTIFNLQANILTTKDILSNLGCTGNMPGIFVRIDPSTFNRRSLFESIPRTKAAVSIYSCPHTQLDSMEKRFILLLYLFTINEVNVSKWKLETYVKLSPMLRSHGKKSMLEKLKKYRHEYVTETRIRICMSNLIRMYLVKEG